MRNIVWMIAVMVGLAASARAEDAWVQVAARPTLAQAQDQAREFSRTFTNVQGFRLPSGWYGIVLGPYSSDQAQAQLGLLLGEGMIPRDSFVAQGGGFGAPFWPDTAAAAAPPPEAETDAAPAEAADPADSAEAALAFEAAMTAADRQEVQDALRFAGIYDGKSDGAFGKATRAALAAWQAGQALAPTGLLAPDQRDRLVQPWRQETALVGLSRVAEAEAGITVDLPMGLVEFDRYDPPFARYRPRGGSGYEILLISMRGGQEALAPLHDRLLGLGLVPPGGQDTVGTGFLSLSGADGARMARAEATRKGAFIKGFLIAGPAGQDQRLKRILQAMEDSFTAQPDAVLDAGAGVASTVSQADLTAGLDVRHPALSHSGVYVDAGGSVLTAAEGLDSCTRLTLDGQHEARLVWQDRDAGIALLSPEGALAP
ncbi:MAG: peptidoglycan-binding protein, partial [Proteobacteria bacterium]|nr:peptidoglycan-binding protein [Pseudomonadota bacterium]